MEALSTLRSSARAGALLLCAGAARPQAGADAPHAVQPRWPCFLILLADDLGVEELACYGEGFDYASTPAIDGLAAEGVLFRNAWSNPLCSPTRATILTGRYGHQTGVTDLVTSDLHGGAAQDFALQPSELILPEMLDLGTGGAYAAAAFGKWHLGNSTVGGPLAPNVAGWPHFDGTLENLYAGQDYYQWIHVVDGEQTWSSTYATTATVDAALAWISAAPRPWIAYVAFNAPHAPFHTPPAGLFTVDLAGAAPPEVEPRPYYKAMIEALDAEIERLLQGLGSCRDDTVVLFLADNGTPPDVVLPTCDPSKAKDSPYEGGINVPLIIAGPPVAARGSESTALVSTIDLFATISELAGVHLPSVLPPTYAMPSVSLAPYLHDPALPSIRPYVFTEFAKPSGFAPVVEADWAIRDERFKLIEHVLPPPELYDLELDPLEAMNLLEGTLSPEAQAAYAELSAELDALLP